MTSPFSPESVRLYGAGTVLEVPVQKLTSYTLAQQMGLGVMPTGRALEDVRPEAFPTTGTFEEPEDLQPDNPKIDEPTEPGDVPEAYGVARDKERAILQMASNALGRQPESEQAIETVDLGCEDVGKVLDERLIARKGLQDSVAGQRDNAGELLERVNGDFKELSARAEDTGEAQTAMDGCFQWQNDLLDESRKLSVRQKELLMQLKQLLNVSYPSARQKYDNLYNERDVAQSQLDKAKRIAGINNGAASEGLMAKIAALDSQVTEADEKLKQAKGELEAKLQELDDKRLAYEQLESDCRLLTLKFSDEKNAKTEPVDAALERYGRAGLEAMVAFRSTLADRLAILDQAIADHPMSNLQTSAELAEVDAGETSAPVENQAEGVSGNENDWADEEQEDGGYEAPEAPELPAELPQGTRYAARFRKLGKFAEKK